MHKLHCWTFPFLLLPALAHGQIARYSAKQLATDRWDIRTPITRYVDIDCDSVPRTYFVVRGMISDPCVQRPQASYLKKMSLIGVSVGGSVLTWHKIGHLQRSVTEAQVQESMDIFLIPKHAVDYSAPSVTRAIKSKWLRPFPAVVAFSMLYFGLDSEIQAATTAATAREYVSAPDGISVEDSNVGGVTGFDSFGVPEHELTRH